MKNPITLILLLLLLSGCMTVAALSGSTQTNTSGSNTAIEGGYTSSTTYESGSSSASTTSNTTNSNVRSAPPSAYAPGVNSSGIDVCSTGASMGIQTFGFLSWLSNFEPTKYSPPCIVNRDRITLGPWHSSLDIYCIYLPFFSGCVITFPCQPGLVL